ncbi:hypothetical protein MJO28_008466 [Puccinia striiformis f. sp. tritici]|uniref:Uncharacterized protein n=1 Tax=Puccinia striiformis f. sp. tritici TaxID=168172 RepID=A0ACC0EDY1_9BASI|nr:hypothetical protein Pst134EA_015469 [Puccinia striiformis f. sp. tritici]KAH9463382.1 hypothetical protein Pst134EA_015469 [Puccinia striiformis f. sp. tritici]KAI7949645.1 hypothetical protein MJO28_008466 [Puccinia striiformis f. sp. tritici]
MRFSSIASIVRLLAALSVTSLTVASPGSILERRHKHKHPPFTNVYIMRQAMTADVPSKIYAGDGTVAFQFIKNLSHPDNGHSTITLMTPSSVPILKLESTNDICGSVSTFKEPSSPGSQSTAFEIYPHGVANDVWRLNYIDSAGKRQNFKFDRDFWDAEGKLYTQIDGHNGAVIAQLKNGKRDDPWLTKHGKVRAYAISFADGAPKQNMLVTFMGALLIRAHYCGL